MYMYAPGTESGTANGEISESGVQGALSTDSERVPGWWKEIRVQEVSGTDPGVLVNGKRLLLRYAVGITAGASLEDNIAGRVWPIDGSEKRWLTWKRKSPQKMVANMRTSDGTLKALK